MLTTTGSITRQCLADEQVALETGAYYWSIHGLSMTPNQQGLSADSFNQMRSWGMASATGDISVLFLQVTISMPLSSVGP